MIENLEFELLHLKADRRAEDLALPICDPSLLERSNRKKAEGKITQGFDHSQSIFQTSPKRTSTDFKRNLKQVKAELDSDSHPFPRKNRNMGGGLLTCDGRPHSPWIKFLSRKSVVGSALLVRYAAHIAEIFTTTSFIQTKIKTNSKKPRFQCFEYGIELFEFFVTLVESSFEKILVPGSIQIAGDIRRDK